MNVKRYKNSDWLIGRLEAKVENLEREQNMIRETQEREFELVRKEMKEYRDETNSKFDKIVELVETIKQDLNNNIFKQKITYKTLAIYVSVCALTVSVIVNLFM